MEVEDNLLSLVAVVVAVLPLLFQAQIW